MDILERLEILAEVVNDPNTAKRISQAAAFQVIAEYKQRIFYDGKNTDGGDIGTYSGNPFYINPNSDALVGVPTSAIKPVGKYGQTVFKNGKPHKTKYLSGGYAELRELTGRQSAYVDLNFSGSLFNSIKVTEISGVSYISYTNTEMANIMAGQESRRFMTISQVSQQEREQGEEAARNELLTILEEIDLL